MDGICTLANDRVYQQLVALLNSIEAILGEDMPVCVYPYDDNTERIAAEIAQRPNVRLYDNLESMQSWDRFAQAAWDAHPNARQRWQKAGSTGYHRFGTHRRYCAFDGPFERFLYMDADTLLMGPVDFIFAQLAKSDFIVYDFQYKDPTHVYEVNSPKLNDIFAPERIQSEIFCSGFYASKKDLFSQKQRDWLITQLQNGDAEIIYPMAVDQPLLNYMIMRSGFSVYNFALQYPPEKRTGCCVTSSHFQTQDYILYDQGNRLTYIHYIGIPLGVFSQLCQGENIDFPYRDIFLHYRYLKEPEKQPKLTQKPRYYQSSKTPNFTQKFLKKLKLIS
jgi:hypothetical protein